VMAKKISIKVDTDRKWREELGELRKLADQAEL